MNTLKCITSSLALVAALAAAGCGGGSGSYGATPAPGPAPTPTPTPTPTSENFTNWFKVAVYAQPADGVPIAMDTLVFNFDANDNPDAFAELFPAQ